MVEISTTLSALGASALGASALDASHVTCPLERDYKHFVRSLNEILIGNVVCGYFMAF